MTVVNLNNLEKSYGITEVLKGFSLNVNRREKLGLIGVNGSGKTTIFKIIAGQEPYNSGNISLKRGIKVGYLSQLPEFNSDHSLYEELETVFCDLLQMKEKLSQLEEEISEIGRKREKELAGVMNEYSELQEKFETSGGYEYKSKIRQVSDGLGFSTEELENKVRVLSGGEKTRLGLVKLLLSEPDLLLLDEPTNHLDIPSRQWLEDYLKEYQGAVIIISHDRYFLDRVVTRIVELKNGQDEVYNGNYSYYLKERKKRYEHRLRTYENQQKKIKKMEESIKRLQQWGKQGDNEKFFKRASSMQKALDRIERIDKPTLGGEKMNLELDINRRSGDEVLIVKDCNKTFGSQKILTELNLNLYWGDKSAIIGRNGTGKTTLLKTIISEITPDKGQVKIGANVKIGYYSQEFAGFNPEDDLVTALRREVFISEGEARNALAAFLFTDDEVFKKVGNLSGGERSRLRLLQLMNGDYNFLILDEPTNHLDLPSREVLEDTLQDYNGTVLIVSHDRYFLNKIIDYTYELKDGNLTKYYGNYDYYRRKKEQLLKTRVENTEQKDKCKENKDNFYYRRKKEKREKRKRQKKIDNLEEKIMRLEEKKKKIEDKMVQPENLTDYNLLNDLKDKYNRLKGKLDQLYREWDKCLEKKG